VFSRASTDGGKTFADPINISNSSDARSIGARIAADPKGNNVYISWIDINENTGQKKTFLEQAMTADYHLRNQ
jgi:hypothetical protein